MINAAPGLKSLLMSGRRGIRHFFPHNFWSIFQTWCRDKPTHRTSPTSLTSNNKKGLGCLPPPPTKPQPPRQFLKGWGIDPSPPPPPPVYAPPFSVLSFQYCRASFANIIENLLLNVIFWNTIDQEMHTVNKQNHYSSRSTSCRQFGEVN